MPLLLCLMAIATTATTGGSVVTIRRETTPGVTELTTGIAISSHHILTLSAFVGSEGIPWVEAERGLCEPETIYVSSDLGLAILSFHNGIFEDYTPPWEGMPETGATLSLVGQDIGGIVSVSGRLVEQHEDGMLLVSAPRMEGLMGAAVFDQDGNFVGVVRGVITGTPGNRFDESNDYLAVLPTQLWFVWADLAMEGGRYDSPSFGVTATSFTSSERDRPSGILIVAVDDGSTACSCGFRPGDVVIQMDSLRVYHPETMRGLILSAADTIEATVWSRGILRGVFIPPLR
jgi:hypothetical protein